MIRFEDIYENVKRHHAGADLEVLRKAYIFSAVEHKGQTRASGEPYLVHPLEVAAILASCAWIPPASRWGSCDVLGHLTDADRSGALRATSSTSWRASPARSALSSSEERQPRTSGSSSWPW
jgi:hypothetical protein